MKKNIFNLFTLLVAAALLLAGSAVKTQAQITNTYTQPFDAGGNTSPFSGSGSVAGWLYWYGVYGNVAMTNDPSMDAGGDPSSGSLLVSIPFGANGDQQTFFGSFDNQYGYDFSQTANALNYTNITFDIRVAPGTTPDGSGNFGTIGVGFYQTGTMGNVTIPGSASNGWVHLSQTIDKTKSGVDSVAAFLFSVANYGGYPHFPITFWIDNVTLNKGGPPPAPPTVSIAKPISGLNVIDSSGGVNDRESIMSTVTNGISWVGSPVPVTYSVTITNYPDSATYQGFASYIFLIPGPFGSAGAQAAPYNNIPSYETAPDYNETNLVFLDIENSTYFLTNNAIITTNYGATATLRYKVNTPNNNSMVYGGSPFTNASGTGYANFGSGNLGSVSNLTALGTWSMTFVNNTNITVMAPNGGASTFTMPAADAALFSDANGFTFLIGSQPNSTAAIGQRVVYSEAKIQGSSTPLDDKFITDSVLNTNLWTLLASAPNGLFVVPTNAAYFINWTVPDIGFSLQIGTNLASNSFWADSPVAPIGQIGSLKETLLPKSALPSGNVAFFRLVKRTFTQLQILLPGQTNAPGTTLGYIGTPTPQSVSAVTPITINAVDSAFHIISGINDQIHITTSDGNAFLPNDTGLVNGTVTISGVNGFQFQTQGSQTITATDTTTGTIAPVTSAPVTVGP